MMAGAAVQKVNTQTLNTGFLSILGIQLNSIGLIEIAIKKRFQSMLFMEMRDAI